MRIISSKKSLAKQPNVHLNHFSIPKWIRLVTAVTSFVILSQAQAIQRADSEFFLIDENPNVGSAQQTSGFNSPQNLMSQTFVQSLSQGALSLLKWTFFKESKAQTYEDYNRIKHFGTWINSPNDNSCLDTRAKVLMRDSLTKVTFSQKDCRVATGTWKDPYTKMVYNSSADIQIDHMVPLKNTYDSGAWKWSFYNRCLYANYMGNPIHLLSVQGKANMAKADKSPDLWLPPNESYRCEYVRNWLIVKLIWRLELTANESQGIKNVLAKYHCPMNVYAISQKDFQTQRQIIQANAKECAHLKPQ